MKLFRIVIKNFGGHEVYNSLISADDETEALKTALKEELFILYDGDTLTITDYENE